MKETYDIIIEKLEQDKLLFDREISEVIESVEYDSIYKIQYDRAIKRLEKGIFIIPNDTNELLDILKEVE